MAESYCRKSGGDNNEMLNMEDSSPMLLSNPFLLLSTPGRHYKWNSVLDEENIKKQYKQTNNQKRKKNKTVKAVSKKWFISVLFQ